MDSFTMNQLNDMSNQSLEECDENSDILFDICAAEFATDDFRINEFKVRPCSQRCLLGCSS